MIVMMIFFIDLIKHQDKGRKKEEWEVHYGNFTSLFDSHTFKDIFYKKFIFPLFFRILALINREITIKKTYDGRIYVIYYHLRFF